MGKTFRREKNRWEDGKKAQKAVKNKSTTYRSKHSTKNVIDFPNSEQNDYYDDEDEEDY
jgi:hypothetical protein